MLERCLCGSHDHQMWYYVGLRKTEIRYYCTQLERWFTCKEMVEGLELPTRYSNSWKRDAQKKKQLQLILMLRQPDDE